MDNAQAIDELYRECLKLDVLKFEELEPWYSVDKEQIVQVLYKVKNRMFEINMLLSNSVFEVMSEFIYDFEGGVPLNEGLFSSGQMTELIIHFNNAEFHKKLHTFLNQA